MSNSPSPSPSPTPDADPNFDATILVIAHQVMNNSDAIDDLSDIPDPQANQGQGQQQN